MFISCSRTERTYLSLICVSKCNGTVSCTWLLVNIIFILIKYISHTSILYLKLNTFDEQVFVIYIEFVSIHLFYLLLSLLKQLMAMPLHGMLSPHLSLSVNPKPNQSIWPMETKQLVKHPSQIICCHCWEPHSISVEGMSEWARHLISRVH